MAYSFLVVGGKSLHSMVLVSAIQQCNSAISACMCVCVSHSVMSNSLRPPWTAARQVPPSMGFSGKEYWSGSPFPSPGDIQDPGIESASPVSPALQVDSLPAEPSRKPNLLFLQTEPKNRKKEKMPSYCVETTLIFLGRPFSRRHLLKNLFEKRGFGWKG